MRQRRPNDLREHGSDHAHAETDADDGTAEIVITTHASLGGELSAAVEEITALDVVTEVGNVLPMVGA